MSWHTPQDHRIPTDEQMPERVALLDIGAITAQVFHLPGKHNQKSHGHKGGGGSWPGQWKSVSYDEAVDLTYKQDRLASAAHRPKMTATQLKEYTALKLDGTRNFRSGDNLVTLRPDAKVSDEELGKFMGHVDDLSARYPVKGGANIFVEKTDAFNPPGTDSPILAETVKHSGMIHLSDDAVAGRISGTEYRGDPTEGLIAHEWGHTQDRETVQTKRDMFSYVEAQPNSSSSYALAGPDEAFAEAFSDHFTTTQHNLTTPRGAPDYQWSSTRNYTDAFKWK